VATDPEGRRGTEIATGRSEWFRWSGACKTALDRAAAAAAATAIESRESRVESRVAGGSAWEAAVFNNNERWAAVLSDAA
jgi:hypothetical protein